MKSTVRQKRQEKELTAVGLVGKVLAILPPIAHEAVRDALISTGAAEFTALTLYAYGMERAR